MGSPEVSPEVPLVGDIEQAVGMAIDPDTRRDPNTKTKGHDDSDQGPRRRKKARLELPPLTGGETKDTKETVS